jgi:transposase-like protein
MNLKLDLNTVLTTAVLALTGWIFTTLQSVDKKMVLVEYQVEQIGKQTYHEDCPFCNHEQLL